MILKTKPYTILLKKNILKAFLACKGVGITFRMKILTEKAYSNISAYKSNLFKFFG
jgi:hypothetical protein